MGRTSYEPGEIAQCDLWFPPVTVPVGFGQQRAAARLPVLTMVCGYSRWLSGRLIPSRAAPDLFAGWWQVIEYPTEGATKNDTLGCGCEAMRPIALNGKNRRRSEEVLLTGSLPAG